LLSPISNHFSRLPLLVYELVEEWSMWAPWGPQLRPWTVEARTVVVRRSPSLVRRFGRGSTFLGAVRGSSGVYDSSELCIARRNRPSESVSGASNLQALSRWQRRTRGTLVVRRCALSGVRGSCAVDGQMHA
jgi:hypothetical protein